MDARLRVPQQQKRKLKKNEKGEMAGVKTQYISLMATKFSTKTLFWAERGEMAGTKTQFIWYGDQIFHENFIFWA